MKCSRCKKEATTLNYGLCESCIQKKCSGQKRILPPLGSLIGKRARIKTLPNYAAFLHGKAGVIYEVDEVNEVIYIRFDSPAKRSENDCFPMSGIYLTGEAFELEV